MLRAQPLLPGDIEAAGGWRWFYRCLVANAEMHRDAYCNTFIPFARGSSFDFASFGKAVLVRVLRRCCQRDLYLQMA